MQEQVFNIPTKQILFMILIVLFYGIAVKLGLGMFDNLEFSKSQEKYLQY